jgi:hypothetical protein
MEGKDNKKQIIIKELTDIITKVRIDYLIVENTGLKRFLYE